MPSGFKPSALLAFCLLTTHLSRAPITQAKPALERLEKHRDEAWYDAGLGHHSKSMASKASVRYNDLTEQQLDVAHNAAARALRAHKGNFSPVTGFHVDPSLHGYKEFRKLPDDLHSVARLLVAGGASRMRQKEWERVDGKWSMERSARMGSDGQRGWVAQSKREQEHIAKVTAHNALALHNHLHGKEVGSMSPQEIAQQAEFSTKKAKAVPSPAKQPELPRIEYPDSDQESVHEPKRGAGQKLAIMGKQAPLALPGPRGWKSADEDRGEEKRSKKLLKWFKPKDKD